MGGPPPPPVEEPVVPGPLDSIDKILLDSDAMDKLKSPQDVKSIAIEIWEQYGGLPNGDVNRGAVGRRRDTDEERQAEEVKQANEANKNRRWERLPVGQTISDVVGSLDDFVEDIKKIIPSVVKEMKGGDAAPPGGMPGGMPPMAAAKGMMLKMATAASDLRAEGLRVHADYIEKLILKYADELE
jgi:hypothetical protein